MGHGVFGLEFVLNKDLSISHEDYKPHKITLNQIKRYEPLFRGLS
jgi:hypothetical protein